MIQHVMLWERLPKQAVPAKCCSARWECKVARRHVFKNIACSSDTNVGEDCNKPIADISPQKKLARWHACALPGCCCIICAVKCFNHLATVRLQAALPFQYGLQFWAVILILARFHCWSLCCILCVLAQSQLMRYARSSCKLLRSFQVVRSPASAHTPSWIVSQMQLPMSTCSVPRHTMCMMSSIRIKIWNPGHVHENSPSRSRMKVWLSTRVSVQPASSR